MKYKTKIAYDFDGVLCDTMPAFHQHWMKKYGWKIFDGETRTFDMPMPSDYNFKDIHLDIQTAVNAYQSYLLPHAYAMPIVREFANEYNESPIIITARREINRAVTEEWLQTWLGIPFTLYCIGGDGATKPQTVETLGVKYFVEDRFRTVNKINSCKKVFMPDRSWNSGRTPGDHVIRVNNLVDVWDIIAQLEEK